MPRDMCLQLLCLPWEASDAAIDWPGLYADTAGYSSRNEMLATEKWLINNYRDLDIMLTL